MSTTKQVRFLTPTALELSMFTAALHCAVEQGKELGAWDPFAARIQEALQVQSLKIRITREQGKERATLVTESGKRLGTLRPSSFALGGKGDVTPSEVKESSVSLFEGVRWWQERVWSPEGELGVTEFDLWRVVRAGQVLRRAVASQRSGSLDPLARLKLGVRFAVETSARCVRLYPPGDLAEPIVSVDFDRDGEDEESGDWVFIRDGGATRLPKVKGFDWRGDIIRLRALKSRPSNPSGKPQKPVDPPAATTDRDPTPPGYNPSTQPVENDEGFGEGILY